MLPINGPLDESDCVVVKFVLSALSKPPAEPCAGCYTVKIKEMCGTVSLVLR